MRFYAPAKNQLDLMLLVLGVFFLLIYRSAYSYPFFPLALYSTSTAVMERGQAATMRFYLSSQPDKFRVLDQIQIVAPLGALITDIGDSCLKKSQLPAPMVTCSGYPSDFYFSPLDVTFQATVSMNFGLLSGSTKVKLTSGMTAKGSFNLSINQSAQYSDDVASGALNANRHRRDVEQYWSEERRAAAVPSSIEGIVHDPLDPGTKKRLPRSIVRAFGSEPLAGAKMPTGVPGTKSGVAVSRYSAVGKIFFADEKGKQGSCSAAVVPSQGKNLIVTAAHCVIPITGKPYTDLAFMPSYPEKKQDQDYIFVARKFFANASYQGWSDFNFDYDVAFVQLEPRSDGLNVEDLVGSYGIEFGVSEVPEGEVIGYPIEPFYGAANKGVALQDYGRLTCRIQTSYAYYLFWICPSSTMMANFLDSTCKLRDLGAGSSGGPWIVGNDFSSDADYPSGNVFGVTSQADAFKITEQMTRNRNYRSPIFAEWTRKLYESASGLRAQLLISDRR